MPAKPNYFKIGAFVMSAAAIAIVAVAALGGGSLNRREEAELVTYMDSSVETLEVGSPVKLRGVRVGHVKEIAFSSELAEPTAPAIGRYILVRMAISSTAFGDVRADEVAERMQRLVADGLRVRLASQGLTGTTYLELDFLDPKENPPLAVPGEAVDHYIPSAPGMLSKISSTVDRLFTQLEGSDIPKVAADLDKFLVTMTTAVEDANVKKLSGEISGLLVDVRRTNDAIHSLVADEGVGGAAASIAAAADTARGVIDESAVTVRAMLADLRGASESARRTAERVERLTGPDGLERTLADLQRAAPGLRDAAEELPALVARMSRSSKSLERMLSGGEGDFAAVLENLHAISDNVRYLTDNARLYPSQILFGDPPVPVKEGKR